MVLQHLPRYSLSSRPPTDNVHALELIIFWPTFSILVPLAATMLNTTFFSNAFNCRFIFLGQTPTLAQLSKVMLPV